MITDPIADMLTRIRNALMREKVSVRMGSSSVKRAIAQLLKDEGYIEDYADLTAGGHRVLEVKLKYHAGRPVIERIDRFSKPGLRRYRGARELPRVYGGTGIAIVSTPKGIMTDRAARAQGVGGEVLCVVH